MHNILSHPIEDLKTHISGHVLLPGDPAYDDAHHTFIGQGTPAVIVRVGSPQDVAATIAYATAHDLTLSIRSGGHSNAGHSTNNGGVVIDLRDISNVDIVDAERRIVRIGGGAIWSNIATALQKHNLAISSGDTKTVGVGGLTLGGGIGWMVRKYGLTLDSLVGAEVVTADGQIVYASATENPELFWALRGGGGNFGVVTQFEIAAHECSNVYAGAISYGYDNLAATITGWRDAMRGAPEELNSTLITMPSTPMFGDMPASVIILVCYAGGDETAANRAIEPLLKLGTVKHSSIERKHYADVLEDAHTPTGARLAVNNIFIKEFTDAAIATIAAHPDRILQIRSVGGAMNRVPADATAFAHRDSEVFIIAPVFLAPDASDADMYTALEPWRQLAAHGNGAYINFFTDDSSKEVAAAYPPETYKRLARIKQQYDPHNVFNRNYNIKP